MMQKVYGSPVRQDGLWKIGRTTYELIYGLGRDGDGDDAPAWSWRERFRAIPTPDDIAATVTDAINRQTAERILSGMRWHGDPVWLSDANQRNFAAIAQAPQAVAWPLTLKLGEDTVNGTVVYRTFADPAEFAEFHAAATAHIVAALADGWAEKDALDPRALLDKAK